LSDATPKPPPQPCSALDCALGLFRRARRPEQKAVRRQAILTAAAELLDEHGVHGVGLNALAARAGVTKSNVYRYFESREEILLTLFVEDLRALVDAAEARLGAVAAGDREQTAAVLARALLAQPRFCGFLGVLSSVLEENVSEDVILRIKRESYALMQRLSAALHRALPALALPDCQWAMQMIALLTSGLWPAAHPGPAAQRVLARPEYACLQVDAERDLTRGVSVILRGLLAGNRV
jgi:AcrR family transcriptional regulator